MPWIDDYRKKQRTAAEAARLVKSGDRVFTSGNAATPRLLLRALIERAPELEAVNAGQADYTPIFISEIPTLFTSGVLPLDVAVLHVSSPEEHGFMSLGTE